MNLNKKIRCALAAVLAVVILVSVFVMAPGQADGDTADVTHTGAGSAAYLSPDGGYSPESQVADGTEVDPIIMDDETPDQPAVTPTFVINPTDATTPEGTAAAEPTADPTAPATEDEPTAIPTLEPADPPVNPIVVGRVDTITRTDPAEGTIKLEWNEAENAQGYHIYWRDADAESEAFYLLSTVKDTSLTIRNLKKGSMYFFRIAAYKAVDGTLIDGDGATLKAGTTPVAATGLYLASGVPTGTLLKWSRNDLCDGYILYRQFDGKWSRHDVIPRDTTEYRDTDVIPGRAYNYRLTAYRMDGSGELESDATPTVKTICGLCAPADNGTTTLLRKMYFKWKKNAYAQGYEVRYSTDDKTFKVLTDTTGTSYTSNRFVNGRTYYFRIYPYRYLDGNKIYGTYWGKTLTITNSAYGKEVPDTYIEVSISQQHMWYYVNGELYVSTDVVTGNYNSMDTPKGYWEVNSKASPCTLVGDGYVSYVTYWIAFIGSGYGIHDASWRSEYGGQIYKGNGSHGCINTPLANVKKIYAKVTIGTPVIVY